MSLSEAEKERFLRALEEDREFRYALMGLLGFREVLDRITRLEERQQRLEERFARLEERFAKLEERFARLEEEFRRLAERQQRLEERFAELEKRFAELEERFARLEERYQRLEERFARLEEEFKKLAERQQRLEERFARLEERQQRLEERQQRLEERFARLEEEFLELRRGQQRLEQRVENFHRLVMAIAHRFGVISEEAFRQAMRYVVEEKLGAARVERWVYRDEEGLVYGHPAVVEVDVVVRDGEHILLEIKSRVSKADVAELHRVGALYARVTRVKPRLVIIGGLIDPDAQELAKRLGVEIIPATGRAGSPA